MEEDNPWFAHAMEMVVTPVTVLVGLLGNFLAICVLRRKEINLRPSFARILIALAVFDIIFIASSGAMFSLRALSETYRQYVYPYAVPVLLPLAQISLTASVYTTVVTCFDRYIAICRPALLGCCGHSEETTSWGLIIGTAVFSVLYNFSRFFEYEVTWAIASNVSLVDPLTNRTVIVNLTEAQVHPTALRENPNYIQYYILVTNFIFMGIIPTLIMIVFNVLVVRAVDEANKRRARMTRRQQRNITVTSMLVTVVIVFLLCHSVKLVLNCFEVYELMAGGGQVSEASANRSGSNASHSDSLDESVVVTDLDEEQSGSGGAWPVWVEYMTVLSHWLLILNSSCNIAIYMHKDPRFKAVLRDMVLSFLHIRHTQMASDDLEDSRSNGGGATMRLQALSRKEEAVSCNGQTYLAANHASPVDLVAVASCNGNGSSNGRRCEVRICVQEASSPSYSAMERAQNGRLTFSDDVCEETTTLSLSQSP